MPFIDYDRSRLETSPQLLAQLFGNRTDLSPLLVHLLQLMESREHIRLRSQPLHRLAKRSLQLQVLLEVILAHLVIYLDQIIEMLRIGLVTTPQLIGILLRNQLDLFPTLLNILECRILLVEILLALRECLQLIKQLKLQRIVGGFHPLLLCQDSGSFLFIYG